MKHARRTSMQQHHARHDAARQTQKEPTPDEKEYYRNEYIQFIDRLMQKMEMDKLQEMLDRAMELTT